MLLQLLGGIALPAGELARAARVTPQTASAHLARMVEGGLLIHESLGRHRYYRLASPEVGQALETLSAIAQPQPVRSLRESDQLRTLRFARMCYDHIAGEVGVVLADRLRTLDLLNEVGRDFVVTAEGAAWLGDFGMDLDRIRRGRRHFARQCLDWSERRHHVAGALGAAMADRMFELRWMERIAGGRAVRVTVEGYRGLERMLGISFAGKTVVLDGSADGGLRT